MPSADLSPYPEAPRCPPGPAGSGPRAPKCIKRELARRARPTNQGTDRARAGRRLMQIQRHFLSVRPPDWARGSGALAAPRAPDGQVQFGARICISIDGAIRPNDEAPLEV